MIELLEILKAHMEERLGASKKMTDEQITQAQEKINWVSMAISNMRRLNRELIDKDKRITEVELLAITINRKNKELRRENDALNKDLKELKTLFLGEKIKELEK